MGLFQELLYLCGIEWKTPEKGWCPEIRLTCGPITIPYISIQRLYLILSIFTGIVGLFLFFGGLAAMSTANYHAPSVPFGWVLACIWIQIGAAVAVQWCLWAIARGIRILFGVTQRPLSTTIFMTSILVLVSAFVVATMGVVQTMQHPYLLTPCQCAEGEWGPQCTPCDCGVHGVCDDGERGTGMCVCDTGWGGDDCRVCDARFKPEGQCNTCKRGFEGDRCERCSIGYTGADCDTCDIGWRPWTNWTLVNPRTTDEDGRHICDDCVAGYYGPECSPCIGYFARDVPKKDIWNTRPLRVGDSVMLGDGSRLTGTLTQVSGDSYTMLAVTGATRSITKSDVQSLLCNGRGVCDDNDRWRSENDYPIQVCTRQEDSPCTSNADCDSYSCRGECVGTVWPVDSLWAALVTNDRDGCITDADCFYGPITNYTGGVCQNKACCEETEYGTGECLIEPEYSDAKAPAGDYCPGYHWINQLNESICEGKGTCIVSENRAGDYAGTACYCASEPEDDGQWIGDRCQCYDADNDGQCDDCIAGYYGPNCDPCPGGGGVLECSGHGKCRDGLEGDGLCDCEWDLLRGGWARDSYDGSCTECSPNFWGEGCAVCPTPREATFASDGSGFIDLYSPESAWQPSSTFTGPIPYSTLANENNQVGKHEATSVTPYRSTEAKPFWVTHNVMACSGHGWCDWGKKGTGACQCYSSETNPVGSASYTLGGRSGKTCV